MEHFSMSERKTLTIGCKMPSGLLLEMGDPANKDDYKSVQLNGANQGEYRGRNENGKIFHSTTEQGFGLTKVDSEFWAAWCKRYTVNSKKWLRDGVLFVADSPDEARGKAADQAEVKTGFEQLDPDKLPAGISNRPAGE
jgi:hypothetical protein